MDGWSFVLILSLGCVLGHIDGDGVGTMGGGRVADDGSDPTVQRQGRGFSFGNFARMYLGAEEVKPKPTTYSSSSSDSKSRSSTTTTPASSKSKTTTTTPKPSRQRTTKPPEPDDEEEATTESSPVTTTSAPKKTPECSQVKCKPPPKTASCQELNIYDKTVKRPVGSKSECCAVFKCYNPNGSYFPYHGVLGNGPTTSPEGKQPKDTDKWKSKTTSRGRNMKRPMNIEVNIVAVGDDDAVASVVANADDEEAEEEVEVEVNAEEVEATMYDMEAQMAKEFAEMTKEMDNMF